MNPSRYTPAALVASGLLGLLVAWAFAADRTPAAPAADEPDDHRPVMVVLDFESPGETELGRKVADGLRLRAARLGRLTLIDPFSLRDALAAEPTPTLDTEPRQVASLVRDRLSADLALWGRVTRGADGSYRMEVAGLDLRPAADRPLWRKTYTAAEPQRMNERCDEILGELTGFEKVARPKEADPQAAARAKVKPKNLVANGDFEAPGEQPRGWQKINGLTTFLETADQSHGRVLRADTDVYESELGRWIQQFQAGAPLSEAPTKTPTRGPKYNTVAGNYGVHLHSDPIPVTPGKTYRLEIEYRCKSTDFFFPKLFFRGWAEVEGDDRIVYDGYLSLRSMEQTGQWKRNLRLLTVPSPEEIGGRRIKYLRLMIFAYWPPGDYWFDNVGLYEVVAPSSGPSGD